MTRTILSTLALAAAMTAMAQQYQVVVTTADGRKEVFESSDIANIRFENAPVYNVADRILSSVYNPRSNNALYQFMLADSPSDEWGDPMDVGNFQIQLTLAAPLSEDKYFPVLPAGFYNPSVNYNDFTWSPEKSAAWIRVDEGEDGTTQLFLVNGSTDVRHTENGGYDIRCELMSMDGYSLDVRYQGPIDFVAGNGVVDEFDEDQDVTFTRTYGRYWGNWFETFADDLAIQFAEGQFDSDGFMTSGYILEVAPYMPKADDPKSLNPVRLPDGVYVCDPREVKPQSTGVPFTFDRGRIINVFGVESPVGTYLTYYAPNGKRQRALITEGSFTVSNNGTRFKFDMVSSNGIHVYGTYDRAPYIDNLCDNEEPAGQDMIDRDVTLNFRADTECINFALGDEMWPDTNYHQIFFTEPKMEQGDFLSLYLFSDPNDLADGVYTVNNKFENFGILAGNLDYGHDMIYSWYGDLSIVDDEGYNTFMTPICGGTVTVTTVGNERMFEFELLSKDGHKIDGTWQGEVHTFTESDFERPAAVKERLFKHAPRKAQRMARK